MKNFLVPTITAATVAFTSLFFYVLFSRVFGASLLGTIIILQAVMAALQLAVVPQSWLYVMSAPDPDQLSRRYVLSIQIELISGVFGTALAIALTWLPIEVLAENRWEAVAVFVGLWASGSTSHQGYLRAKFAWVRFIAFVIWPSIARLVMILIAFHMPALVNSASQMLVVVVFFLFPDITRLIVAVTLSLVDRSFALTPSDIIVTLRRISHNWIFDFGTGIIENIDKILVGWILSPSILVIYFFARRIGGAATIAIEPFYAELYRRMQLEPPAGRARKSVVTYGIGSALAFATAIAMCSGFALVQFSPVFAEYIPIPVLENPTIFVCLLLIDSLVCANRWIKFLYLDGQGSATLLVVRLTLRAAFGVLLLGLKFSNLNNGIVLAYFATLLLETGFVTSVLRKRLQESKRKLLQPDVSGI